jgi:transposase
MGRPYADDLRLSVVRLIEDGHTREEVAQLCGVSLSSVGRFVRRFRVTGGVSPDKFGGYKGYALAGHAERIKRWIAERPDGTLFELRDWLAKQKVRVSQSAVFRFVRHLGLTRKKSPARRRAGPAGRRGGSRRLAQKAAQARFQAPGLHR